MHTYDWQGTVESCMRTLRHDPDHLGALEVLAQAQWFGGMYDAVISTTSRLLRLNPCEPGYRYTRGMAYLSIGNLAGAYEDFTTAIAQSDKPEFRAQVSSTLDALERWIAGQPFRGPRLAGQGLRPSHRVN